MQDYQVNTTPELLARLQAEPFCASLYEFAKGLPCVWVAYDDDPTPRVRFRWPTLPPSIGKDRLTPGQGLDGAAAVFDGVPRDFGIVMPSGRDRIVQDLTRQEDARFLALMACLNTAFQADPDAIHALTRNRVPCNAALANHPYVVVDANVALNKVEDGTLQIEHFSVGAIGLLNGVLTAIGLPRVAWVIEDGPGNRRTFTGFTEYRPTPEKPAE